MNQDCSGTIRNYGGETFVAFLDICGFKKMMKKGIARHVLSQFYSVVYDIGRGQKCTRDLCEVDSLAMSDCAVLFARNPRENSRNDKIKSLRSILRLVQKINYLLAAYEILTTCSIAFGSFWYENRIEVDYMRENYLVGAAYVDAYLDNEGGDPPLQPSQCRLLKAKPMPIRKFPQDHLFSLLKSEEKHYYFYWMLHDIADLKSFESEYKKTHENFYENIRDLIGKYMTPASER
jgi:hypothetical protein